MPCFTPMKAWRKRGGGVTFEKSEGYTDLPSVELQCDQCRGCRLRRSRDWAVRIVHEASMHEENCFLTLTYSPENLPNGATLVKADYQKFMKRLRKAMPNTTLRYYMVGEYGETSGRPHYHACLFGAAFSGDRLQVRVERGNTYYASPLVDRVWGLGHHVIGHLTWQSAAYVARYIMTKKTGDQAKDYYGDRLPEYNAMSRGGRSGNGGVGSSWLDKYGESDVYPEDEVVLGGKRFRPPRYYDLALSEERLAEVQAKRQKAVKARKEELSPERLKVREKVAEARLSQLHRNL